MNPTKRGRNMIMSKVSSNRNRLLLRAVRKSILLGAVIVWLPIIPALLANGLDPKGTGVPKYLWSIVVTHAASLVIMFLAGTLSGAYWFIWRHVPRLALSEEISRVDMASLLASFHRSEFKTRLSTHLAVSSAPAGVRRPIIQLLSDMGILKLDFGSVVPSSEAAEAFLCSLTAHLVDGNPSFIGNWHAGSNSPEHFALIELLRKIEEYRIGSAPGKVTPARRVRAGLALIRCDIAGAAHFLMIKSDRWDKAGAWWFVGGTEENSDGGDLGATVTREVCEEAKLENSDVILTKELTAAIEQSISLRLGILTEVEFRVFAVQLRQDSRRAQPLLTANRPTVTLDYNSSVRIHEFEWQTWQNLLSNVHLARHTPKVLEALRLNVDPASIPQSYAR